MKPLTPFREGHVFVCSVECETCIFRPGNRMQLAEGRLKDLVQSNLKNESALTCHSTIWFDPEERHALCRGYFDRCADQVPALRLARMLDIIEFIDPPTKSN